MEVTYLDNKCEPITIDNVIWLEVWGNNLYGRYFDKDKNQVEIEFPIVDIVSIYR